MANLSFSGVDDLMLSLQEVAEIPDEVQNQMLNAGADVLIPEIKARGEGYGVRDSGDLLDSLTKSKIKKNQKVGRYISIYFKGSRVRGKDKKSGKPKRIKNSEIAFLNEYGTRHQPARPFVKDTIEMSAATVTKAQSEIYDEFLKSKDL